ncbi:hypothetical protein AgCh_005049 [Apium graveolens]
MDIGTPVHKNPLELDKKEDELPKAIPTIKIHPLDNVLGDLRKGVQTQSQVQNVVNHFSFLSQIEPKTAKEALLDEDWISAMQEELLQFSYSKVWELVPKPRDTSIIEEEVYVKQPPGFEDANHPNRYESIRVPILRASEYPIWKVKMTIFLEATDPEYLDRINDGPYKPTKLSGTVVDQPAKMILKEKSEYTTEDISSIAKDARVMHMLHSVIDNVILNDLSLVDKEYDLEDSNLKFLLALPENWDLKSTTISDNYDLAETTLDEIYESSYSDDDDSDSEEEVNYALMANADSSSDAAELKGNSKNILVLDSGCSRHMTVNKALLSDFVEKAGPGVSYGDDNMGKTMGYGNINLGNVIIETVALVSGLKHNLLSVSQICDRGYHVDFFEEHCEVLSISTGKVVLKGYRHGNIYEARLSTNSNGSAICLLSRASIEESWNWHKRLSHLNFNNINELVKKDLVRRLPKSVFAPDGLCDSCQKAKQRKSSFRNKTESSILEPYHLLHVDLFGPVNVMSIAKKKYAMVIVDEFTRYTWVYFLHKKNETASALTDHVRQLDKLVKDSVKIIRTDNDTEFKNSIMEEFCKEHRIKQEFSAPGTPQQNGVVERKNMTLIEAARTMLDEAKLPTYFWVEAVQTAYFTQNATLINKYGKHHMRW